MRRCRIIARGTGFGDEVEWMKLDEGLAAAKESNKIAMVVVHKSWCGACKRLGPSFAAEQRVKDLAENFVMINVHDDGTTPLPTVSGRHSMLIACVLL